MKLRDSNQRLLLDVPQGKVMRYRRRFGPSLLDHVFVSTDTEVHAAARQKRDEARRRQPLPVDPLLLDRCQSRVEALLELGRSTTSAAAIAQAAHLAAAEILAAVRNDPAGSADLTDVLSQVADILEERVDTQFALPDVWIAQSLLYGRNGEPRAAQKLVNCTIYYLSDLISSGYSDEAAKRHLTVAYSAKADLHEATGDRDACLVAAKQAWDWARQSDATYQRFVIGRYRRVLEAQNRAIEVVQAVARLERQLDIETAGRGSDWILGWV